jgi:hypothetical protein
VAAFTRAAACGCTTATQSSGPCAPRCEGGSWRAVRIAMEEEVCCSTSDGRRWHDADLCIGRPGMGTVHWRGVVARLLSTRGPRRPEKV